MIKKIIMVMLLLVLPIGFAATNYSAEEVDKAPVKDVVAKIEAEEELHGTITEIEGARVVLKCEKGEMITMNSVDEKTLKDLKVADKVMVKDGKITKEMKEIKEKEE